MTWIVTSDRLILMEEVAALKYTPVGDEGPGPEVVITLKSGHEITLSGDDAEKVWRPFKDEAGRQGKWGSGSGIPGAASS